MFILAATVIPGLVSCAQADDLQPETVTIQTDRNNYVPIMSSTVGIGLTLEHTIEMPSETLQYHWRTNYGCFVAWDTPDLEVKTLGPEVIKAWTWE